MVNCKNCGKTIITPKWNQVYCNVKCRCEDYDNKNQLVKRQQLKEHEIKRVKDVIFDRLKGTLCGEDKNENDFLFHITLRGLIQWGELYDIAHNKFENIKDI